MCTPSGETILPFWVADMDFQSPDGSSLMPSAVGLTMVSLDIPMTQQRSARRFQTTSKSSIIGRLILSWIIGVPGIVTGLIYHGTLVI
jgi:bifunctional pyridoxal-dependent enzyme with beta-cystathionase and maltose regulon repressor activities